MNVEWFGPVPNENFSPGRRGNPIALIVDHWMASSFSSALARFMNPQSEVSAHYMIGTDGRIMQLVFDADTAFHAGAFDVNLLSIGIEHEASPTVLPSDVLYAASAWLHHTLALRHNIDLIVGITVKPHRDIVPTQCPGTLDLERIVREAQEEDMDQDQFNRWFDARLAESPEYVNTIAAIKGALIMLAGSEAELRQLVHDTEYQALVTALLDIKPEALKPQP